jgi:Tfp pilus assembly protein PilF
MTRREKLETMLADDPQDQLLRYMLAMELDKEGDHDRSLLLLDGLMSDPSPYVPAFLMAGQQYTRLDRMEAARAAFQQGIAAAQQQGDMHAFEELKRFLSELGEFEARD